MIRPSDEIDIARVECLIIDESVTSLLLSFFFLNRSSKKTQLTIGRDNAEAMD